MDRVSISVFAVTVYTVECMHLGVLWEGEQQKPYLVGIGLDSARVF